jgi:16S rRNA A1518/A1519 N6-dimethyltransferase RsmA/KsgA/DIM1 with predicted DNA glycosylase/AP lyase activity
MKTQDHEIKILEVIEKNAIFTFKDIFVYYKGCTRATAYNLELDKFDTIKEAIQSNKRKGVTSMLAKWVKSENATLQIAAMRLLSDNEERQMLNQQYIDHTTKGEKIHMTEAERLTEIAALKAKLNAD